MLKLDLDAIDFKILRAVQADARLSNADLAEQVGLSPTACLRRWRRLEKDGFVGRYVAVLDQAKVGLPVSVFAQVKVGSHDRGLLDNFEQVVRTWPEVLECYLMTGPRDYLLRVVVEDVAAYERFIKEKLTGVAGVTTIESSFALQQVKYVHALPI